MAGSYTHKNINEVDDSAEKFGFGDTQEARFASEAFETEQTGLSHHRMKPGKRQTFGHHHEDAEEVYFVVSGSGRIKLDDDIIEVTERDAIRISPGVMRSWEAGDDGLEVLAFGPRHKEDPGELVQGWWSD